MNGYWPWWAGAAGLALVTINYTVTTDRFLGVSGAWDRVLHWRKERRVERLNEQVADDRVLVEALAAATAQQFGARPAVPAQVVRAQVPAQAMPASAYGASSSYGAGYAATPTYAVPDVAPPPGQHVRRTMNPTAQLTSLLPAPLVSQAALLLSIFLGGLVAAITSGRFHVRLDMGEGFRHLVTGNPIQMVGVLFIGGVLVGFGTRLAGGCSSGHGLSGCGRLQPVSLVATAVFFGAAVVVSFLLWKVS